MLPLACARAAVEGVRGEGSVNKLNCTILQPGGCGGWGRVGDAGTSGEPLEDRGVLDVKYFLPTHLNRSPQTTPFFTGLVVTLQAGIRALL